MGSGDWNALAGAQCDSGAGLTSDSEQRDTIAEQCDM